MSLETGTNVSDLVITNPTSSDAKSQGDDHFRLVKTALRNNFAGFTGNILVTGTDGGAADAYTLTPTTTLTAYSTKMLVEFTPNATNTGASTLNISGLGAKNIFSVAGAALSAGDLVSGGYYVAAYDGTQFRLLSTTKNYIDTLVAALPPGTLPSITGKDTTWKLQVNATGDAVEWGQLVIPTPAGSGGRTITGNVTLTVTAGVIADAAISVTPTAPGLYVTLPVATTITTEGVTQISVYNAGDFDYGVKDSAGTQLGWVRPRTGAIIGLADNSTAAGVWVPQGLEKTGITAAYANPTITNVAEVVRRVALDANRTCFLFGDTTCYAIVYDASTQAWGTATTVRTGIASGAYLGVLAGTDKVLVVSCDSTTAMEGVTLTISGTGITVNTGTKGTATLGGNWASFGQLLAVSTWFVLSYGRATASLIQVVTVSGTTVAFAGNATLTPSVSTSAVLFVSGVIVRTVNTSATVIYAKPYTSSAGGFSAGTEASATTTNATFRALLNGNGNIVCQYANTTHYATIFKLTGTVEAASSVSLGTVPGALSGAYTDYMAITASKTAFFTYSATTQLHCNILTDTSGTASAGTQVTMTSVYDITVSTGVMAAGLVQGNNARFVYGFATASYYARVLLIFDCSAASPTLVTTQPIVGVGKSSGGNVYEAIYGSDLYGVRAPLQLIAGNSVYVVGGNGFSNTVTIGSTTMLRVPSGAISYDGLNAANGFGVVGGSSNVSWSAVTFNTSTTGMMIECVEAAA